MKKKLWILGIAAVLVLVFFKLSNILFGTFEETILIPMTAISMLAVYMSLMFNKEKVSFSIYAIYVFITLAFVWTANYYIVPNLGVTGIQSMVEIPIAQNSILGSITGGILDFIGIPIWSIYFGGGALLLLLFFYPKIAIFFLSLIIGIVLFFVTPGFIFDDIGIVIFGIFQLFTGKGTPAIGKYLNRKPMGSYIIEKGPEWYDGENVY